MYKAKQLKVNNELGFYVGKGSKYFPQLKYQTLKEAEEQAIIENIHQHYQKARNYFKQLEKLMPEKYDDNKGFESDKTNFEDLLC